VRAGLPTKAPDLGLPRYLELMGRDKKALGGQMRFVVLDAIGRASMRKVPDELVAGVIERATRA
jgi:3-dehydroquinate synthase